jgi:hypothetical protein
MIKIIAFVICVSVLQIPSIAFSSTEKDIRELLLQYMLKRPMIS